MRADLELRVPARPSAVRLLRTVAASAAAHVNASIDDIEDLRLAVTEAASELIAGAPPDGTLRMALRTEPDAIGVTIWLRDAGPGRTTGDGAPGCTDERSLAWQVLLALVGDLRSVTDGPDVGLSFSKPLGGGATP